MARANRIARQTKWTAYAFAGVYALLAAVFARLSHRVVFGILIAAPVTRPQR